MATKNVYWDHQRVADAVIAARDALNMTQDDLAARAGVSDSTLRSIEQAAGRRTHQANISKIEQALGWDSGTIAAIAHGGAAPISQADNVVSRLDALERQVAYLQDQIALVLRDIARSAR